MAEDQFDFKDLQIPKLSGRMITWGIVGVIVLLTGFNTLYQVQPEEVGVVLRLGRYVRTTEPGLRAKLPILEEVFKVPVQRQLKQEFGFRTVEADARSRFAAEGYTDEAIMLTGDLNVAVVEWIVQYKIKVFYVFESCRDSNT